MFPFLEYTLVIPESQHKTASSLFVPFEQLRNNIIAILYFYNYSFAIRLPVISHHSIVLMTHVRGRRIKLDCLCSILKGHAVNILFFCPPRRRCSSPLSSGSFLRSLSCSELSQPRVRMFLRRLRLFLRARPQQSTMTASCLLPALFIALYLKFILFVLQMMFLPNIGRGASI